MTKGNKRPNTAFSYLPEWIAYADFLEARIAELTPYYDRWVRDEIQSHCESMTSTPIHEWLGMTPDEWAQWQAGHPND